MLICLAYMSYMSDICRWALAFPFPFNLICANTYNRIVLGRRQIEVTVTLSHTHTAMEAEKAAMEAKAAQLGLSLEQYKVRSCLVGV